MLLSNEIKLMTFKLQLCGYKSSHLHSDSDCSQHLHVLGYSQLIIRFAMFDSTVCRNSLTYSRTFHGDKRIEQACRVRLLEGQQNTESVVKQRPATGEIFLSIHLDHPATPPNHNPRRRPRPRPNALRTTQPLKTGVRIAEGGVGRQAVARVEVAREVRHALEGVVNALRDQRVRGIIQVNSLNILRGNWRHSNLRVLLLKETSVLRGTITLL